MKNLIAALGAMTALAVAAPAANAAAVLVPVGTLPVSGTSPYFFVTSGAPMGTTAGATFGATPMSGAFDYAFTFHVAFNGVGSGSLTTSFVGVSPISNLSVSIDGTPYTPTLTPTGYSLNVGNFPLAALALNTIEVTGTTTAPEGFTGTIAYAATAVPEPATWATFLVGFGFMGLATRRKLSTKLRTA